MINHLIVLMVLTVIGLLYDFLEILDDFDGLMMVV